MGLFDLTTPLFAWVDVHIFAIFNNDIKIILWSLLGAVLSTVMFKSLINTEKLATVKNLIKKTLNKLNNHDGDFKDLKILAKTSIVLSLHRLRLTLLPSLAAAIPLVFLLVFISHQYDYDTPEPQSKINYQISWQNQQEPITKSSVIWPSDQAVKFIKDSKENHVISLPFQPVSVIHKKQWWNVLVANPAGYIPSNSDINEIKFDFEAVKLGPVLNNYFDSWHWPFFIFLSLFSFCCFFLFKIKF